MSDSQVIITPPISDVISKEGPVENNDGLCKFDCEKKQSEYLLKSSQYKGFHYSVLNDEDFDYLHNTILKIFLRIREIFERYGIRYMICGGTLLGAATTGKFIPWDDDFDLCVFEEDYDKAKGLLIKEMSNDFVVQCRETESHYFHGWVKIRDKHSCVHPMTMSYANNGVWVDMYKLKKVYYKDFEKLVAQEHLEYLQRRYSVGDISKEEFTKRVYANNLYERIENATQASFLCKDNTTVYVIWSASKVILEEKWIFPLKNILFEGVEVTTFSAYKQYLIAHYGADYDVYPKDEYRRIGVNQIEIL